MTRYFAVYAVSTDPHVVDLGDGPTPETTRLAYQAGADIWTEEHLRALQAAIAAHLPVQVVANVSGGALHGVWSTTHVDVLFISDDADDLTSQDGEGKKPLNGGDGRVPLPYAWWLQAAHPNANSGFTEHFFNQLPDEPSYD